MSMSWYPGDWEIYVDNPGYGEIFVRERNGKWERELVGEDIADFLADVTAIALDLTPRPGQRLSGVTNTTAREVLPALQRAVILAAAAGDRFERLFRDEDEPPQEPLCVRCNEGTCYSDVALPSKQCDRFGHAPFGMGAETKWERAQAAHAIQLERWERQRERDARRNG
jgi:hypothetical protein